MFFVSSSFQSAGHGRKGRKWLSKSGEDLLFSVLIKDKEIIGNQLIELIDDNTIVPGIKGKEINEMESFLNMKDFKSFNEQYLIFDYII